jgi:peptidoglycan/LPS O-acetylase OafA/YrhL
VDIFKTPGAAELVLNPLSKFLLFGFGMMLAHLHSTNPAWVRRTATLRNGICGFVLAAAAGIALIHYFPIASDLLIGAGCAALLAAVVWATPAGKIVRLLSFAPVVFLGELSFGIYMWHMSVIAALRHLRLLPHNYTAALLLIGGLTIGVAAVTYLLVERPALSLKRLWAASGRQAQAEPGFGGRPLGRSWAAKTTRPFSVRPRTLQGQSARVTKTRLQAF